MVTANSAVNSCQRILDTYKDYPGEKKLLKNQPISDILNHKVGKLEQMGNYFKSGGQYGNKNIQEGPGYLP